MRLNIGNIHLKANIEKIVFYICVISYVLFSDDANAILYSKLMLFLFFIIESAIIFFEKKVIKFGAGAQIVLFFTVYCALSIFWSYNRFFSTQALFTQAQLSVMFMFFYWYFCNGGSEEDYFQALFLSGIALAVYAMIKYHGPVVFVAKMLTGVRMGGYIQNENTFGLNFTYAYLAAIYFYVNQKKRLYLAFAIGFVLFALSSGSKKALFIILVGFLGVLISKYGLKRIHKIIIPIFVFIIFMTLALQSPYFAVINNRLDAYLHGTTISDTARETMREFGIQMIRQKPFLGWGLRGFQQLYYTGQYSHDNFVEVAVSLGGVGFVIYYLLYIYLIVGIISKSIMRGGITQISLFMLVLLLIDLVFGYGMVQIYARNSWVLLAAAHASYENDYKKRIPNKKDLE